MKKVLLLLADGFELLEAAGFTDVFGWANIDGEEPIELVSAGLSSPLKATFGFSVIPDKLVSDLDIDDFHALAVPGGFEGAGFYHDAYRPEFLNVIRVFEKKGKPVASVCVASLSLGKAGVLKNRRATVYHQIGGKRKVELEDFGAKFVDEAIVKDGNIISSTGPGTGIEVAFELLKELTSVTNVQHIRALMRIPTPDPNWRRIPQVYAQNYEVKNSLESERQ